MNETLLNNSLRVLNTEQREAIKHIVGGWQASDGRVRLTIVDGPPGTGKTFLAAVAAGEWVRRRRKPVVLLAPTHTAAERARSALANVGFESHEAIRLAPGPVNQAPGLLTFESIKNLPRHMRRQLSQAWVLVTTWHGAQRALEPLSSFLLLFDEVSQIPYSALLSLLYRAYLRGPLGFALIGDPHQLPVVTTQDTLSTNAALGILRRHPQCTPHRLLSQYRMNSSICEVVNMLRRVAFGGAPLRPANQIVAQRTIDQISKHYDQSNRFHQILNPTTPVVFVDTSRFSTERGWKEDAIGGSWVYEAEARLAVRLAHEAQQAYCISIDNIMVLSPYRAQAAQVRALGYPNSRTIYRAQGEEWDCVILTLGRTSISGRTILDEVYQHIYVGLSRAKTKLIVLLNASTFRTLRLFGPLLQGVTQMASGRLVEADPQWAEP